MRKYMKNYQEWYNHIAGKIENKPIFLRLLRAFNRFMTVVMPIVYLTLLTTIYYLFPRRIWETGLDVCVYPCIRFCDFVLSS